MNVENFLQDMLQDNDNYYSSIPIEEKTYWPHKLVGETAIEALKVRWFNEYIGVIVLARLIDKLQHPKLKMLVGRQVGDEAKHAQVCEARINALGGSVEDYTPLPEQLHMYQVLDEVSYPEEFFAAMQFTTEHEGVKRNEQALERFDKETADMFRDSINPDELFHVQLGWTALRILCTTEEAQERARVACRKQRELHHAWTLAYRRKMLDLGLL